MAYEGNKIAEKLRMAEQQKQDDIHIYVRRLYLVRINIYFMLSINLFYFKICLSCILKVVMAIKEVIKTIEFYQKTSVTPKTIIDLLQDFSCKFNI